MAVFGAPTAHEDDPERAVRAALAIRDWLLEQPELQVRIAVNTGEALVALDARPEAGEGMVSATWSTRRRDCRRLPWSTGSWSVRRRTAPARAYPVPGCGALLAKGKRVPLAVWEAIEARSRLGSEVGSVIRTPLVGRDRALRLLTDSLARVGQDRTPSWSPWWACPGSARAG